MKMRKLLGVFFALSLFASVSTAQAAAMMWLEPAYQEVGPSDPIFLTVHMDFTDGTTTLAGGFDIFYDDSILDLVSFTFNPAFLGTVSDPAFSRTGDDLPGHLSAIGIGSFGGITGAHLIGTLEFASVGVGLADLWFGDGSSPAGPLLDFTTGAPMSVAYTGAQVLVTPLPAAAWLMMAGIGFLVGFGRRKMGVSA